MGVQEVKAQADDVAGRFERVAGLDGHFHFAQKKGYSGVGLYTRKAPSDVVIGFGSKEFDAEGRYVEARFDTAKRKFSVISCYFPSGSSGEERQAAKFRFLARMYPHLVKLKAEREFILVGDVNIAHQEIDLKNWKSNQKNSGFLPEERAWMTKLLDTCRAWSMCSARSTRSPSNTPGGATAARPGPRTSVGGWTTTWPRRPSPPRPGASRSTSTSASPTMRRWSSTTTSSSEPSGPAGLQGWLPAGSGAASELAARSQPLLAAAAEAAALAGGQTAAAACSAAAYIGATFGSLSSMSWMRVAPLG